MWSRLTLTQRIFQTNELAKRLICIAQMACDLSELDVAAEVMQAVDPLALDARLNKKDQHGLTELMQGVHTRLWKERMRLIYNAKDKQKASEQFDIITSSVLPPQQLSFAKPRRR